MFHIFRRKVKVEIKTLSIKKINGSFKYAINGGDFKRKLSPILEALVSDVKVEYYDTTIWGNYAISYKGQSLLLNMFLNDWESIQEHKAEIFKFKQRVEYWKKDVDHPEIQTFCIEGEVK